jgi:hypothetical protein
MGIGVAGVEIGMGVRNRRRRCIYVYIYIYGFRNCEGEGEECEYGGELSFDSFFFSFAFGEVGSVGVSPLGEDVGAY